MGFITRKGRQGLLNYKYHSGGYSWLDNKMNPYWETCVNFLPNWMAPNMVTFVGFLAMVSCYCIMLAYDANFNGDIPRWVFYYSAGAHFFYQTMDAIDGKHARNLKAGSPLG